MATYQYCVAINYGPGFIEKGDSRRLSPLSFPGNLWRIPADNTFSTQWIQKVSGVSKTLAEAQAIVDAAVAQVQADYDAIPADDPRKIEGSFLYKTRPTGITLEE